MASITYSSGTIIPSTWLNDVNVAVYTTLPTLAPLVSASLITPNIGNATATSVNKNMFTQPTTGCTWTLADGKTLTVSNTLTLSGVDGASLALSGTSSVSGANTGDQLVFKTISVSGQSDVVADTITDTLTLVAGTGMSITTNASTDTITLTNTIGSLLAAYAQTADQTITFGGTLTIAHGLGAIPKIVMGFLKCTTAELGYSVGDIFPYAVSVASAGGGVSVKCDATNLSVVYGTSGLTLINSSGASNTITAANWKFFMKVFA